MKKTKFIVIFNILVSFFCIGCIQADESDGIEKAMSTWMHWKVKHIKDQKNIGIIEYLNAIGPIYSLCRETTFVTKESDFGMADPKKATKIINSSLKRIKAIKVPLGCQRYHEIILQIIEEIKRYHELRIQYGDTEVFWENAKNLKLEIVKKDSEQTGEYYLILNNIGFYDNILEEMKQLEGNQEER